MIDVIATETDMMGRSGQIVEIHSETQVVDTIFSRCISFTFFILLIVFFTCLVFLYSSYGGIITSIALAPSAIGAFFAIIGALDGDITRYDLIIIACVAVMAVGVILLTIPYLCCLVATREHSYYRFLLKVLDDIRNRDGIKNVQEKNDVNDKKANKPMV